MNFQNIMIGGRFCHDHELRYTPKGTAVLTNTVAVNRKWTDGSGQKKEAVTFFEVKAWQTTAENLNNYTGKGTRIILTLQADTEKWEDKNTGQPRSKQVYQVLKFEFVDSVKDEASRGEARPPADRAPAGGGGGQRSTTSLTNPAPDDWEDDDIPF